MFVAICRWRVHPEREQDFVVNGHRITRLGLATGSGGSSLFKDAQDRWVAIARWPSREARERFFEQMDAGDAEPGMGARARLAVSERLPAEELDGVLGCWAPFPETTRASGS